MITVYGADWCEDTRRSQRLLRRLHIPYRYVNIDEDLAGPARAQLGEDDQRTPRIDLGLGGQLLVEPDNEILTAALVEREMLSRDDAHERLGLQNVGDLERVVRTAAGLGLVVLAGTARRRVRWPLRLLGLITAASGVSGWCPGYSAADVTSLGGPGDRPDEAERSAWVVSRTQLRGAGSSVAEDVSSVAGEVS